MFRTTGRVAAAMMVGGAALVLGLGAAAGAKTTAVKVEINDDGCPAKLTVKAGPTNFKVTNAARVTSASSKCSRAIASSARSRTSHPGSTRSSRSP